MNSIGSTLLLFLIKSIAINEFCEFFVVLCSKLLGSFHNVMVGPDEVGECSDIH